MDNQLQTLNITLPIPAIQGFFGRRQATYTTQIPALQIRRFLGHDPRTENWGSLPIKTREIYERIQRRDSSARTEARIGSAKNYLRQRISASKAGAFPAISIGVTNHMEFVPSEANPAVGILKIDEEGERIVLDGLGRVTACLDLSEESDVGHQIVSDIVLPVTLYLPAPDMPSLSIDDLGQLFMDFNFRVHPVATLQAVSLDRSDLYISLANKLGEAPFIRDYGGMQTRSKTVSLKQPELVSLTTLIRVVRGAVEGREFQESNLATTSDPNLTEDTFGQELRSLTEYFGSIAGRMGERWSDHNSLHLTAPGWQALGLLHFDMYHSDLQLSVADQTAIYDKIANIDWSRENRQWVDEIDVGQLKVPKRGSGKPSVVLSGAGRSNTKAIIDYLRRITGVREKLESSGRKVRTANAA